MKLRAIIAGIVLGIATLSYASYHLTSTHLAGPPKPLCPPDAPDCGLN